MKVKIRGIYSTALTHFLMEKGFNIAKPSGVMQERINIDDQTRADIQIYDKEDLNGVTINGVNAEKVVNEISDNFKDVVIKKMSIGEIYVGKIKKIESKSKNIIVDLGDEEGILTLQNYWGFLREGEKVLVQVKGTLGNKKLLSTKLRLFGNNMILIKEGFTKVSKHIKSEEEIKRLTDITNNINAEGWGILWKSLAEGKPDEELIAEINQVLETEKMLKKELDENNEPKLLETGSRNYFIDFGGSSKQQLDKIRSKVTTTIVGHHFLKSGGYSIITDFAELLSGLDDDTVMAKMNKALKKKGPREGMYYEIIHKKPTEKDIIFRGTIEKINNDEVIVKRKLIPKGRLDGLGIKIEEGDYALTNLKPNSWTLTHKYFNKDGVLKGVYNNINTPIEIYPNFARYIDLEIDTLEVGQKKEIIDGEALDRAVKLGMVKKELADKAIKIANELISEE